MQIMTLMSGTIISQVVMFAFMPILTRLYTPGEFGIYSLFFAVTGILGVVSSWKYDQAIMLPKSDKDAQALIFLSIMITLGMAVLSAAGLFVFYDFFLSYFEGLAHVIWMIPIGILLIGLIDIFTAYTSRKQYYKQLASVRVVNTMSVVSFQGASKYLLSFDGLIFGKLFADTITLLLFLKYHIKKQTLQLRSISRRRMQVNAKRYENYPKYTSFGALMNTLSANVPVLLLTSFYSVEAAGLYALTVRVLQVPVRLIGGSTREVYYQRASRMYASGENIFNLYKKTTLALLKIFIIPFIVFFLFGESMFSFIFGEEWNTSGTFAQILIFWFLFLFINSPTMISFDILMLQKLSLLIQIISLSVRILSLYIGYWYESIYISILLFTLASVLSNIVNMSIIYRILLKKKDR